MLLPGGLPTAADGRGVGGVASARGLGGRCERSRRGPRVHRRRPASSSLAGPRVIDGIEILAELIDPAAFDGMAPPGSWARVG